MRHLSTLALAGLFGGLLLAGDASACHKAKKACACPAPAPVCAPAPAPVCAPAPVVACAPAPKKTCHFKMPKMPKLGHKKAACAPTYASAPVYSEAPVYAAPQTYATSQASGQGM